MFVFYDWPFQHMYSAKNVANIVFPFNSWLSLTTMSCLLWGYAISTADVASHWPLAATEFVFISVSKCKAERDWPGRCPCHLLSFFLRTPRSHADSSGMECMDWHTSILPTKLAGTASSLEGTKNLTSDHFLQRQIDQTCKLAVDFEIIALTQIVKSIFQTSAFYN